MYVIINYIILMLIFLINFFDQCANYEEKNKNYDKILGHAMTHIVPIQLLIFFALIYKLITYEQIMDEQNINNQENKENTQEDRQHYNENNPYIMNDLNYNFIRYTFPNIDYNSDKFKKLKHLDFDIHDKFCHSLKMPTSQENEFLYEYYPGIKAPPSTMRLWVTRLHLQDIPQIANVYEDIGYQSIEELNAEMRGYYQFWTIPRYIFNIFLLYFQYIFIIFSNIYLKYTFDRQRPLGEKRDKKPVFDIYNDKYIKRVNIECNPKNTPLLWNNGLSPSELHLGNLGIECANGYFNR